MTAESSTYKSSPVVGYVRSAQRTDPRLDEWEARIRAYAGERGYNLATVLREEGISGVSANRPVLETLIRDLSEGKYVGVVLYKSSDLGNSARCRSNAQAIRSTDAWLEVVSI